MKNAITPGAEERQARPEHHFRLSRTPTAESSARWLGLLLRVHLRQTARRIKAVRDQSRLLSSLVLLFVLGYCVLSFFLFRLGLGFLGSFPGLGTVLVERLVYLLFAFLFFLLLFSNLVISYSNLFRNRETAFLLSTPMPASAVFQWKFIESTLLASWAFLFLVTPLLAAFGLSRHAGLGFYGMTTLVVALFVVLPGVAGAWFAANLARHLDRRLFQVVGISLAAALLAAAAIFLRASPDAPELQETRVLPVLDRLLGQTRFALFPWLPSYWLSSTLLQWSEGAFLSALFFGGVLLSHALFFGLLACTRMGGFFYDSFSIVQSRSGRRGGWRVWIGQPAPATSAPAGSRPPGLAEKFADLFRFIPPDRRAVMLKDARVFWRDTTQWGQTLVLFGLLAAYILNLRHLSQQLTNPFWVHLVSYLNLGACSLNLATLTTRFVFPQFSLEGKRLWVVGLAPIGLAGVVRAKLQMASTFALLLTVGLTALACVMLKLGGPRTLYLCAAVAVMSLTLTGLAVGLGVLYPNFKEENPSKIVSGFGGTFCLVLSFLYIVASVATLAATSPWPPAGHAHLGWSILGWLVFAGLSLLLGALPCHLGLRRAANFEF